MSLFALTLALTLCLAVFGEERRSYVGHQVLRCLPTTPAQIEKLRSWDFDYWMEPRKPNVMVDIGTSSANRVFVEEQLKSAGIECRVMIKDVQDVINAEAVAVQNKDTPFIQNYHEWTEVYEYLDTLVDVNPKIASTEIIGQTYQGKDIKILKLSTDPSANKPALWYDGGIHAREWITVAVVTYMADTLVRGFGVDSAATTLLNDFDVYFAPIINVDGYEYTWHGDRNWRKTRSTNVKSNCVGTDPNRNWAFHWGEAGANNIPCSDSYQGPFAASEPEVQAVQSYICSHNSTIRGYINFHSYAQLWMSNWGYTDAKSPDYDKQNGLSAVATAAIKAVYGTEYEYGPISTTIYPASGSSADYTYGVCGVKYSYGVELRDTGKYGFLLPADQIVPSGVETLAGIYAMANYIKQNP